MAHFIDVSTTHREALHKLVVRMLTTRNDCLLPDTALIASALAIPLPRAVHNPVLQLQQTNVRRLARLAR